MMKRQKKTTAADVALALLTCLNLLLTVVLHLLHRQEILHAVQNDDEVAVLLTARSETKTEKSAEKEEKSGKTA